MGVEAGAAEGAGVPEGTGGGRRAPPVGVEVVCVPRLEQIVHTQTQDHFDFVVVPLVSLRAAASARAGILSAVGAAAASYSSTHGARARVRAR
jgi:hypothetical protein